MDIHTDIHTHIGIRRHTYTHARAHLGIHKYRLGEKRDCPYGYNTGCLLALSYLVTFATGTVFWETP